MPATFAFARSAARTSRLEPAGTLIVSIERGAMELTRVAPAAVIAAAWVEELVPWEKVTR